MAVAHCFFDGTKTVPLSAAGMGFDLGSALDEWDEEDGGRQLSPTAAYGTVPYLYRAVDIRAKAISGLPWTLTRRGTGEDVAGYPQYQGIASGMAQRLFQTEQALCLYGAAYWLKETNRIGHNLTPRWVMPTSITPRFDSRHGLVGFVRTFGSGSQELSLEQVVRFWVPAVASEVGPGMAPARVALSAARILHHFDSFIMGFFRRGLIKPMLISFEGNPSNQELQRIEDRWRRMLSGVRNAWRSLAVRGGVKVIPVGDGLSDVESRDLVVQQREHICTALGVPHSLLSSNAATRATAEQDTYNFYTMTVLPEARLIADSINQQLLAESDVQFRFAVEQVEALQQQEVLKARSLTTLVKEGVITVDEARRMLGYSPLPRSPKSNAAHT